MGTTAFTRPETPAAARSVRRSAERGTTRLAWLDGRHTFSFAGYHDPAWTSWSVLRVLNDDRVAPARGFEAHPHRDMEILTVVLDGELEHRDSLGNGSVLRPGDVQRMTAGRGIVHSEWNPSPTRPLHLLQIWIVPERRGLEPSYEERHIPETQRRGRLRLVASPDGGNGSVRLHQDARVYAAVLGVGENALHEIDPARTAWVHVARGEIDAGGLTLRAGDGLGVGPGTLEIRGGQDDETGRPGEILLFDLPAKEE